MMASISAYLEDQHKQCDSYFYAAEEAVSAGNWDEAGKKLSSFITGIERHFDNEEQVLFPDFEHVSGQTMGPTQVMRLEHDQMRELFDSLRQALLHKDMEQFLGDTETLMVLMQQHNAKEEQILYPLSDQVLMGQREDVIERMRPLESS